jgi:hypothetical protein
MILGRPVGDRQADPAVLAVVAPVVVVLTLAVAGGDLAADHDLGRLEGSTVRARQRALRNLWSTPVFLCP